jgi:hypothetical protein
MLRKVKISYIPILKEQGFTDNLDLPFHKQLLDIVRPFFAGKGSDIEAVGTTIMSKAPNIKELIHSTDEQFYPQNKFKEAFFIGQKIMFYKDNKKYILQFVPFLYSVTGADITSGVFDIKNLLEINALSSASNFRTISYGPVHEISLFKQHTNKIVDVVDALVSFNAQSENANLQMILPFYTLEHFIETCFYQEDVDSLHDDWLSHYQALKAVLEATKCAYKVVLGLKNTVCEKSIISLSEQQKNFLTLFDIYKSPRFTVNSKLKAHSDEVLIETFYCFEHGNIVTLVSWLKSGNKRGTEIYYHVSERSQFLDQLEKDCIQQSLKVSRKLLDFFDDTDRLNILRVRLGLH